MTWQLRIALVAVLVTLASAAYRVHAFTFLSHRWPNGTIQMQLQLGGGSGRLMDGRTSWNKVFIFALNQWNNRSLNTRPIRFTFVNNSNAPVGSPNGFNNVIFRNRVFGRRFAANVLAVAVTWRIVSTGTATESNIVFKKNLNWNSYRGRRRTEALRGLASNAQPATGDPIHDLGRVGMHESGHTLGLGHPDEAGQNKKAIMNSTVSNIDKLRPDDIKGARRHYRGGGLSLSRFSPLEVLGTPIGWVLDEN